MANDFDKRPLSERFDLNYARQRTWPKRQYQFYSLVLALVVLSYVAYAAVTGDQRMYSSGDISRVHAWFADDCAQCHEPDPSRHGYWLTARDESCLKCHAAEAHHPLTAIHPRLVMNVHDRMGPIDMAARCIDCHVEHQGYDHDLNQVSDAACVACHQNLDAYRQSPPAPAAAAAPAHAASTTEGQP